MINRDLKSQRQLGALQCDILVDARRNAVPFCDKDSQTLLSRGNAEGSSYFKVTLPTLGRALDSGLVTGQFTCPKAFQRKGGLPIFCNKVFNGIFDQDGFLLAEANPVYIKYLRQLLLFESKVWEYPTPEQSVTTWASFKNGQLALRQVPIPTDNEIVTAARKLLKGVLRRLDLSTIVPGHGPGAVAECLDSEQRWDFRYWPTRANKVYPYFMYGIPNELYFDPGDSVPSRSVKTRVVMVPKDYRGPRLISVEPVVHQYLQQGQMRSMYSYVAQHPILRRSIDFSDQSKNQRAASTAYQDGSFTLDLSNASDTVSATLVWHLLSDLPSLRKRLFATRTEVATFGGDSVELSAFSPMGSAVCFPIQSLVFWSLTMASLKNVLRQEPLEYLASQVKVFGDDIIAPDCCYDTLLGTLRLLGMSPNLHKTCRETPFRESCGTEWYAGHDVSVVRNRKTPYGSIGYQNIPDLVSLQRTLYAAGLYQTANSVALMVRDLKPVPSITEPDIRFPHFLVGPYDNCHTRFRWNKDLQRLEAWTAYFSKRSVSWSHVGKHGLLARLIGDSNDRVPLRDVIVKTGWCPYPVLEKQGT